MTGRHGDDCAVIMNGADEQLVCVDQCRPAQFPRLVANYLEHVEPGGASSADLVNVGAEA